MSSLFRRAETFCARFGLRAPILLVPMAGAYAPELSIAVADTGGLGPCGALLMQPDEISARANRVRAGTRLMPSFLWLGAVVFVLTANLGYAYWDRYKSIFSRN